MIHEQMKLHVVVSMLCIFSFPYYEETCLNKVVICITLEKPLHGNELLMQLCKKGQVKKIEAKMG